MNAQKEAFLKYEADNYFNRNQAILSSYSPEKDPVITMLREYQSTPKRVLEIGCNAGYRLNGIKTVFPDCEVYGIEPSTAAIDYGKKNYQNINFVQGTTDDLGIFEDAFFDLIIIGFVFYVVDRAILLKTIGEIDRVLQNKGALINIDFFAQTPHKKAYTHINQIEAYSYKQSYEDIFTASRLYLLTDKRSFNHSTRDYDISESFQNKMTVSLLQKNLDAGYSL
jgi:ubiquinone/menaquinone biosynthesis C-methylase UbiE